MRSSVTIPAVVAALVPWLLYCSTASAQNQSGAAGLLRLERSLVEVTRRVEGSVVAIARYRLPGSNADPDRQGPPAPRQSGSANSVDPNHPDFIPNEYGTGIVVSDPSDPTRRLVLTCFHVVRGGPLARPSGAGGVSRQRLHVRFANRRGCPARIFAADPRSDLAVLELDPTDLKQAGLTPGSLKPLAITASPTPRKGRFVLLLGNPFAIARDGSASVGWALISNTRRQALSRPRTREGLQRAVGSIHRLGTLLQLDTRLKHGTSGGPVLDLDGRLLGLTTSIAPRDGIETSAGFAIPFDKPFVRIIDTLRKGLEVEYGFLGVQPEDVSTAQLNGYNGSFEQPRAARAARVFRGSPAQRAGIRGGDLILAVDKHPVLGRYELMRQVELVGPGGRLTLDLWRETTRRRVRVSVTLGKWPLPDRSGMIASKQRHPKWRGIEIDYPTGRLRFVPDSFEFPRAVVVTSVQPGSPADEAGIEAGDFIETVAGRRAETPAEFFKTVDSRRDSVSLKLLDGRRVTLKP